MASSRDKNPSQDELNTLISYYQSQNYGEAERLALILKRNFPSHPLSLKILSSIFYKKGKINEALDLYNNLLKLTDINLNYKTDNNLIKVLQDINIEVKLKETLSIVGESGSGKTSLIMLIGGLEKVSSGKIFFENNEITNMSEDEISNIRRKNIGIVFQSFYLIPNYTALENVSLTLEINKISNAEIKAKEILERFGLSERFYNLPSQLSGGEQQRVAIARSIVMKPKLILADEPTGNLDSENSELISKILFDYVSDEKASLIMVTHDNNLANRTMKKIKIKDGRID